MPMDPEWLPVLALLLAGIFAGAVALSCLTSRETRRGLSLLAGSIALIAFALLLGGQLSPRLPTMKALPLTPAAPVFASTPDDDDPDSTSMSLRLGAVTLRLAPSDRYVLSVDGRRFLELEATRKGLLVSCEVKGPGGDAHIRRNNLRFPTGAVPRLDSHTIVLGERGAETFRVRYADRRTIEVMGTFYPKGRDDIVIVKRGGGVRWTGGGVSPGTTIDLRHFGRGTVDFERSGLIRVLR